MKISFSQVLTEVTGGTRPICTVKEIASVARVHEQTVYSWKNDDTEPRYSKLMDIAHFLNKRGYHRLSLQFFDNPGGEANGCVKDETIEIVRQLAIVSDATDGQAIINAAGEIKRQARNLMAEGRQL